MKINALAIINFVICLIALVFFASLDMVLLTIGVIAIVVSIIFLFLLNSENYKTGFWLFLVSMIIFLPISIIGIIGARKIHDNKAEEEFELRRKASKEEGGE